MARMARAEVFAPDEVAVVHVMNRVVHRCYLLGAEWDKPGSGTNEGTLKQFRFAESVRLMTAEREGAKASQRAKNHRIFVVALPENA